MKINSGQLAKVADLSRLDLNDEEKKEFALQLSDIISYVEKINELDTDEVHPTDHIVELKNVFRSDDIRESVGINIIKDMAPDFGNDHIIVPLIIEAQE